MSVLALALVCVFAAGSAMASGRHYSSSTSIAAGFDPGTDYFHGKVASKKKKCRTHRVVTLYRARGDAGEPDYRVVDRTKSASSGAWRTKNVTEFDGYYMAYVHSKRLSHGRGTCESAVSKLFLIV